MKYILILILAFTLIACETAPRKQPTPFAVSERTLSLKGCNDLHKNVKVWNTNNPEKEPRIADC